MSPCAEGICSVYIIFCTSHPMASSVIEISRDFESDSSGFECSSHMTSATAASTFCLTEFTRLADMFPHLEVPVIRDALSRRTFEDALDLLLAADSDMEFTMDSLPTSGPLPCKRLESPPPLASRLSMPRVHHPLSGRITFDLTRDDKEVSEQLPGGVGGRMEGRGARYSPTAAKTSLRFESMEAGESPDSVLDGPRLCFNIEEQSEDQEAGSGSGRREPAPVIDLDSDSDSEGVPEGGGVREEGGGERGVGGFRRWLADSQPMWSARAEEERETEGVVGKKRRGSPSKVEWGMGKRVCQLADKDVEVMRDGDPQCRPPIAERCKFVPLFSDDEEEGGRTRSEAVGGEEAEGEGEEGRKKARKAAERAEVVQLRLEEKAAEKRVREQRREEEKRERAGRKESEKTEKARAKEVKKMSVPESAPFRNCTCYDKNLPTGFRAQLLTQLSAEGYAEDACTLPLPNAIVWRLTMPNEDGTTTPRPLNHCVMLYPAPAFLALAESGGVDAEVARIKAAFPRHIITLLLPGLFPYVKKQNESRYRGGVSGPISRVCMGEVLAHIAIAHSGVHTRCTDDNLWSGAVEYIAGMHRTLAQAVYSSPASLLSTNKNGGVGNKSDPQWDQISFCTWGKMVVSIPGVSTAHALAIRKEYSTMRSLMKVYRAPHLDAYKEKLLQGLEIVRFGDDGIGRRDRVGEAISKKVFRVLTMRDNNVTMAQMLESHK